LFLERGYDGAAMSELAKRAGITTPALYWHFKSKADLCAEVLERDYSGFLDDLRSGSVGATPEERLRAFISTYVALQLRDRNMPFKAGYVQLRDRVSDSSQLVVRDLTLEIVEVLKAILDEGREAGAFDIPDPTLATYSLITMSEWVYTWYRPGGRLTANEVGAYYGELAANLVRPATA
jgi:AcrR family transcriptional regulator